MTNPYGWDGSRGCTVVCISCHTPFDSEFGKAEITCSHCGFGWGPDWKAGWGPDWKALKEPVQDRMVEQHITEPIEPEPSPGTPPRARAEKEPGSPGGPDYGPVLTDAKLDEICAHIEKTIPIDWAALLCDVDPETLTSARKRSAAVRLRIERARAKGGAALVQLAHTDANNGRSIERSKWLGACLYPKQLNPAQVFSGPDGGPIEVAHHEGERVRPRWMLEFFRKNARWPTAEEHPTEEELKR